MKKKKVIVILIAAAVAAVIIYILIPSSPDSRRPEVTDTPAGESAGERRPGEAMKERDTRGMGFFQRLFSGMENSGEYQRGPEDPESPGARTREMFVLIGKFAKSEKLPKDLLLPPGATKEEVDDHMKKLREILQYEALVKDGTATIAQRTRLYETKKLIFEEKIRLIEAYQEHNTSAQDKKAAEKKLGLLRDRIKKCDEELRKL